MWAIVEFEDNQIENEAQDRQMTNATSWIDER